MLRVWLGNKLNIIEDGYRFLWVTEFPLFEWDEKVNEWVPCHHIFTQPFKEDIHLLDKNPGEVRGRQYDLVLNGIELASGSIRNHNPQMQRKLLHIIGLTDREIDERFGFLLKELQYGAPPHGGIAPGIDRICMVLAGSNTIRDVIAFPKTLQGAGLMEGSPSEVSEENLDPLHIKIKRRGDKIKSNFDENKG